MDHAVVASHPSRRAAALSLLAWATAAPIAARAASGAFDTAKVVAAMDRFVASPTLNRTPGVSAAVMLPNGQLVTSVRGWADPQRRLPMTPANRLMSGSTGKTFCAACALSLVEDGKLTLDAPIAPIFADEAWYRRLPNASALTLRMLLMHTEGFPQFLDLPKFQLAVMEDSLAGREIAYPPRKMLGFILDTQPLNPPGKAHHYSDLGYHLIGLAMEKVTGLGYYEILRRRVLSKVGGDDVIPSNRRDLPLLACGYARGDILNAIAGLTGRTEDDRGILRRSPALEYTGGGLALPPRALARFYFKLARGEIVSPASFAAMTSSTIADPATDPAVRNAYGLGITVTTRPGFGTYFSHSGYFPGYNANVAYYLDHGFAAAVQQNTDHGPDIYDQLRALAKGVIDTRQA